MAWTNAETTSAPDLCFAQNDCCAYVLSNQGPPASLYVMIDKITATACVRQAAPSVSSAGGGTTLRVKDGETVGIGGLRQKEASNNVNKAPLLGDVPLLGQLFRPRNRVERESEWLILVTPTLLKG